MQAVFGVAAVALFVPVLYHLTKDNEVKPYEGENAPGGWSLLPFCFDTARLAAVSSDADACQISSSIESYSA